ncbi:hypothetical protein GM418_19230 [Maribellus comscasis]|uniref:Argininosuccinate lyase n=1 Tax=Maribellus comscasis TaxID=2681766 RepID=A0A6I6JRR0_9BACT|nr:lyase family protein [Maribellus comscasis]QGY45725.1 hypothetical protein GM418_19230 [Maribellus comscasis]
MNFKRNNQENFMRKITHTAILTIFFECMFSFVFAGHSVPVNNESTDSETVSELLNRIDEIYKIGCDDWITASWSTMLIKQGIVPKEGASRAARVIMEMIEKPGPVRGSGWDYFMDTQAYFNEKLGKEVGGNLMVVRTTPPARQTVYVRYHLLKRLCQIYDMQLALLNLAEKHKETIMPGYTHERHAQPTTYAHYLMSVFDAVQRSTETLDLGYHQMSLNEMGCGALAGTSWNIDRNLVSKYLGMEGLIENSNDAAGYTDGYLVVVCGLTNITNILSRMALELTYWSGAEYGFIESGNKGTSFLMPQKSDNPNAMEIVQLTAGQMTGHLVSISVAGLRVPQGDSHHMLHMEDPTMEALDASERCITLMTSEVSRLDVNKKRMYDLIKESYIASTELANQMVRDYGLDYRTSHKIVHSFVLASEEQSIPATNASANLLNNAALEIIGRKLNINDKQLRGILNPEHFINVTNSQGGVAPEEVERMIVERKQTLEQYREKLLKRIKVLEDGQKRMISDLNSFENQ